MPAALSRFLSLREYRECFLRTRDELHARGFATLPVFFEKRDIAPGFLSQRFKKEDVDTVIWFLPDGSDRDSALRLRDLGIRFVGVNLGEVPGAGCKYEVRRSGALRSILRSWRSEARIKDAVFLRGQPEAAADAQRARYLRELAKTERIDCDLVSVRPDQIEARLEALCAKKPVGISCHRRPHRSFAGGHRKVWP